MFSFTLISKVIFKVKSVISNVIISKSSILSIKNIVIIGKVSKSEVFIRKVLRSKVLRSKVLRSKVLRSKVLRSKVLRSKVLRSKEQQ